MNLRLVVIFSVVIIMHLICCLNFSLKVLSDVLFMMELVAASSSDEEDCTHIYTQTSRMVSDLFLLFVSVRFLLGFCLLIFLHKHL